MHSHWRFALQMHAVRNPSCLGSAERVMRHCVVCLTRPAKCVNAPQWPHGCTSRTCSTPFLRAKQYPHAPQKRGSYTNSPRILPHAQSHQANCGIPFLWRRTLASFLVCQRLRGPFLPEQQKREGLDSDMIRIAWLWGRSLFEMPTRIRKIRLTDWPVLKPLSTFLLLMRICFWHA